MSATPVMKNGKPTGLWSVRYQLNGKRYRLGNHFESQKVAEIAEEVHKLKVSRLKDIKLANVHLDLIDGEEHTPWRPEEYRNVFSKLLDATADRFYKWRKARQLEKAIERDTFLRLNRMETKRTARVFEK